jgi:hypothetical protein
MKKTEDQKSRATVPLIKNHKILTCSVAEPHHIYAAPSPAPGKNFDAALAAPAPAPTLLYSKAKFLKRTKF